MSFYGYMLQFLEEDPPRGDLARDMLKDAEVANLNGREELRDHFSRLSHGATAVMNTFYRCWAAYKKEWLA